DVGQFEINSESFGQDRRFGKRKAVSDFMCRCEIGLNRTMRDGQLSQCFDFLKQSIALLFLDDVAQEIAQRTYVTPQWLFLDFRGNAGEFIQPLMLVRCLPEEIVCAHVSGKGKDNSGTVA